MSIIWNVFFMLGGVATMMLGMKLMGNALEQVAGKGMKKLLGKVTTNRFAGIGVGVAVTSIIQSSTATTVMLVGFVNIGLMSLAQATNVIMGANIGTTITAHIVSLSGVSNVDIGAIASMVGFAGIMIVMLLKNDRVKSVGNILVGLGMIFIGLEFISNYATQIMFVEGNKLSPHGWVRAIFQADHFPLLLVAIGVILTAFVHSSSTITSLMVVLASVGVLTFENALFLALGANIGTCITSILSSAGAQVNAKRTAIVHLLFNVFGCLIFIVPLWIFKPQIARVFASISSDVGRQIAVFHTLFNVVTTLVLLPFVNAIVKLACLIIPEASIEEENEGYKFQYIDNRMLQTPPIAVSYTKKELVRMSEYARTNVNLAMEMLFNNKIDNEKEIRENELIINHLNRSITEYLTKLMSKDLTNDDEKKIGSYYHVVSDIERVGDYAENILEYALKLREEDMVMSEDAKAELKEMNLAVNSLYEYSISAFDDRNVALLDRVNLEEEKIDGIAKELENKHIDRVKKGLCKAQVGSVYLQTASNLERVGDHIHNIAKSIKQYSSIKS